MTWTGKAEPVFSVSDIRRDFRGVHALRGVSLSAKAGEIHALLGPNGAGKTTLLRILTGLVDPTSGSVQVADVDPTDRKALQRAVGFVPASDRSFYMRLSARENLSFFGRLHGFSRKASLVEAARTLESVGLSDSADRPLYGFSHGMLKRLAVARALLTMPMALLVDEATHDLDPEGARQVRDLVQEVADAGGAVLWTTQRVEEIRGFADRVTVLTRGEVRFSGSVSGLLGHAAPASFLVTARNGGLRGAELAAAMQRVLGTTATIEAPTTDDSESFGLTLGKDVALGEAIAALTESGITITGCRDERPEIEEAFVALTAGPDR
jgi:ABC-2 type transport system ATP-binding protein